MILPYVSLFTLTKHDVRAAAVQLFPVSKGQNAVVSPLRFDFNAMQQVNIL